jgi:aminoglycoside phosphotransferase (APT) family kinase protein
MSSELAQSPSRLLVERAGAIEHAMASAGCLESGERVTDVRPLSGGWSRRSYIATSSHRRLIVRAKPVGGLLDTDLFAEHALYVALAGSTVPVPAPLGIHKDDSSPFGGPFFVMDHVEGDAPNAFRKRDRTALEADWNGGGVLATEVAEHLARIHTVDVSDGYDRVPSYGFLELVDRWKATYDETRLVRDPIFEEAFAWVADREPAAVDPRLVHGDYRIGNLLVRGSRVTAVLDWELAYLGDPRFDLGYFALEYTAGRHLRPVSDLIGAVADRGWFYEEYELRTDTTLDRDAVRTFSVLGILMLVGTLYTGIGMYQAGRTSDIRMLWNRFELPGLRDELCRLMDW